MLTQSPIAPSLDLRDMARQYIVRRGLASLAQAAARRQRALRSGDVIGYRDAIREAIAKMYGELPVGRHAKKPRARLVSALDKASFRIENVLFESFPGWEVNASVFVPLDYTPPFPAVVVAVGHDGKQFNHQRLAQFFARSGWLAVVFDPPGQAGEKRPGNDHFVDGVRCFLVGETSNRYFVADALRCIDYLETRRDVDLGPGVAMTGNSGGGYTSEWSGALDDRVALVAPSCCMACLADYDLLYAYNGCPETHIWRRYEYGVDEIDVLAAAFPKPVLMMAGQQDEVYRIESARRLAKAVQALYRRGGAGARFELLESPAGHAYTMAQARHFVRFANRWLLGKPDRPMCELPDDAIQLVPAEELRCSPRQDVNMRSITLKRALQIEKSRNQDASRLRKAAREVAGVHGKVLPPTTKRGKPFLVWTHHWRSMLLNVEKGIELPATFLHDARRPKAPTVVHFDDRGRHADLYRHGKLTRAIRLLQRDQPGANLLTVDLRGWGDTAPAVYPYELPGWGSTDRWLAYTTASLGDAIMSMRIRDGLSGLAGALALPEVAPRAVVLTGCGLGGMVALHLAAIHGAVRGVVLWNSLVSFRALLEAEAPAWPADAFVPGVLLRYDLPELAASLACPVHSVRPLDGAGQPLSEQTRARLNRKAGRPVYIEGASEGEFVTVLQQLLATLEPEE